MSYQASAEFHGFEVFFTYENAFAGVAYTHDGDFIPPEPGELYIIEVWQGKNRVPVAAFERYMDKGRLWDGLFEEAGI